ncbi:MAG: RluA family pseudouridine synthase [Gammaproteobacteria bacterium]|nr:RluA family pseudouridine synthase [Gammaproteobacteria bacterium]
MTDTSKVQMLVVPERQDGQRLDNFLLRELKGLPRSRVYRLIRTGEVRVNRGRCKPDTRLYRGDQVRVPPYAGRRPAHVGTPTDKLKQRLEDSVLFENEALLVLNKPSGMPVHGGSGIALGLIEALRQIRPEWMETELAHRLDRDTSGCLVIAKQADFLRHMQAELRAGKVKKTYLALVQGAWPEELDMIDLPLRKNELASGERIVRANPDGKSALTTFQIRERLPDATLLQIGLETGRTHQIRVHCQSAGHPIIGDEKYGKNTTIPHKHLALHAWQITFRPNPKASPSHFEAPCNSYFTKLLQSLRNSNSRGMTITG